MNDQVEVLPETLKRNAPAHIKDGDVLNYILLDERNGNYPGALDQDALARRGVQTISCRLVNMRSQPYIDEKMLVPILLSLS